MVLKNQWNLKEKLISIVSICLIAQLLISYPLWLDNFRTYPKMACFESLEFLFPGNLDILLFILLLITLILFSFGKTNWFLSTLYFSIFTIFVMNDMNRLQVWNYQMTAMLIVLIFAKQSQTIKLLQLIMIFIYFWSGIQKLNIYFIEDVFPWFLQPFGLENFLIDPHFFAFAAAVIEFSIGIGLFFNRTRPIAIYLAVGLHLFILIILSPIGHNWNQVVWPWNICMIALLFLLFYKKNDSIFESLASDFRSSLLFLLIIVFFGIMPIFNFFGLWDEQLSFKMYSGISPEGVFYYQDPQLECIPNDIKERFVHVTPNTKKQRIILDDWAFYNLKVAPYKSKKRLLQMGKILCQCVKNPDLAGLELLEVKRWNKKQDSFINFPCTELIENEK